MTNGANNVNYPHCVIRGVNSQTTNECGVHWLRISFDYKDLSKIKSWVNNFFGDSEKDGYGLWSYDSRYVWHSGVSLNFDADGERCRDVHKNRITLDCPGSALDELTAPDLLVLLEGFQVHQGKCTRIDVFFDDYSRLVTPTQLHDVIDRGDYSGFGKAHKRQTLERGRLVYDEVSFGRRGDSGSGKYLRVYDKQLESNGELDCIRWEVEFSREKAQLVFSRLAYTKGNLNAFATICGALVGGCINFVHRTGDKNISRLDMYDFWSIIVDSIGQLSIRIKKEKNTIVGVREWVTRQVSPSLACLRKVFVTEKSFFDWLFDVLEDGDSRMNAHKERLAEENIGAFSYTSKYHLQQRDVEYAYMSQ